MTAPVSVLDERTRRELQPPCDILTRTNGKIQPACGKAATWRLDARCDHGEAIHLLCDEHKALWLRQEVCGCVPGKPAPMWTVRLEPLR